MNHKYHYNLHDVRFGDIESEVDKYEPKVRVLPISQHREHRLEQMCKIDRLPYQASPTVDDLIIKRICLERKRTL